MARCSAAMVVLAVLSLLVACNQEENIPPRKIQAVVPADTARVDSVVESVRDTVIQDTVVQDSEPVPVVPEVLPPPKDSVPVKKEQKPASVKTEKKPAVEPPVPAVVDTVPADTVVLDSAARDSFARDSMITAACSNLSANEFCDRRDGKRYRFVAIGRQKWMSQNLAYEVEGSWCVNGKEEGCSQFGRLYRWDAANVCPNGWRLPSMNDFTTLKDFIQKKLGNKSGVGTALKTISGWEEDDDGLAPVGTNEFGFAAKPAGYRDNRGNFVSVGSEANFWTSQEVPGEDRASYWNLYFANQDFIGSYVGLKTSAMSVRCIKK